MNRRNRNVLKLKRNFFIITGNLRDSENKIKQKFVGIIVVVIIIITLFLRYFYFTNLFLDGRFDIVVASFITRTLNPDCTGVVDCLRAGISPRYITKPSRLTPELLS